MGDNLERRFSKNFGGSMRYVSNFKDFGTISIGENPTIIFKDSKKSKFYTSFQGLEEVDESTQRVFLQYSIKINKGGLKYEETKVGEFNFPLEGKIQKSDLEKYIVLEHEVNK